MREQIEQGLLALSVPASPAQQDKMAEFLHHMLEKNKVMNLTAITQESQVVGLHLLDSAALYAYVPQQATSLIDIGTGAGFPGVPLQILRPDLTVTLMDALEKRLNWLSEMADELALPHLRCLHGRAEELPHDLRHRENYDVATARAVADLRILAEVTLPFVKVGGRFLAMKSCDSDQEIEQALPTLSRLGATLAEVKDYAIPGMDLRHRLLVIEKQEPSPTDYPRRWAKIKNSPIKAENRE